MSYYALVTRYVWRWHGRAVAPFLMRLQWASVLHDASGLVSRHNLALRDAQRPRTLEYAFIGSPAALQTTSKRKNRGPSPRGLANKTSSKEAKASRFPQPRGPLKATSSKESKPACGAML